MAYLWYVRRDAGNDYDDEEFAFVLVTRRMSHTNMRVGSRNSTNKFISLD